MKNLFRIVSLVMVLVLAACVVAFADPATGGIYDLTVNLGTVTPKTAANADVAGAAGTSIGGGTYTFYSEAERLAVEFTGVADAQYMVFLIEADAEATICPTPTEANIKYVNQAAGAALSFNVYPSRMTNGKKYFLVLTCSADDTVGIAHPLATFKYFAAGVAVTGTVTGTGVPDTVAYSIVEVGEVDPIQSGTGKNISFDAIPDGNYQVIVSLAGYAAHTVDVTVAGEPVALGDIELLLWGDANGNGSVQANDAAQVLRKAMGRTSAITDSYREFIVDANNNSSVQANDAAQVLRKAMGRTSAFDTR